MTQIADVFELMKANNGQITNADVEKKGISRRVLTRMAVQNQIERIAPGIYIDPMVFGDDMAALQYRFSKGIFFKSTALFLHGMIDKTPDRYEMNFPLSYSYSNSGSIETPVKFYRQTNHLYAIGIEEVRTPGEHIVRTYNVERTLCDILRMQYRADAETIKQAMHSYAQSKDRNIYRLVEYAKIFKVENEIRRYMEVLL